jgi:hypothetical protein
MISVQDNLFPLNIGNKEDFGFSFMRPGNSRSDSGSRPSGSSVLLNLDDKFFIPDAISFFGRNSEGFFITFLKTCQGLSLSQE